MPSIATILELHRVAFQNDLSGLKQLSSFHMQYNFVGNTRIYLFTQWNWPLACWASFLKLIVVNVTCVSTMNSTPLDTW